MRVGIGRQVQRAVVAFPTGGEVQGPGGLILAGSPAGAEVAVVPQGAAGFAVTVAGLPPAAVAQGPLRLIPGPESAGWDALLGYKGHRYRGSIEIRRAPGGGLTVVNILPLEHYLRGVVPREMPALWPQEALKAQAVAARTYALKTRESGKYAAEGFDVTDDTSSQVYGGADAEHPNTDAAVLATAGQVLTYEGELITTFFHSQSGGHTEDNEVIFTGGTPVPYLRGVPDYDRGAPYYRWEVIRTPEEFTRALTLSSLTAQIGQVRSVEPTGIRGAGGRWSHWRIVGTQGEMTLTGQELRQVLDLRSSPREVVVSRGESRRGVEYRPSQTVTVLGAGGVRRSLQVAEASVQGADSAPEPAPAQGLVVYAETPVTTQAAVVVRGGGWGHGVGLSQWGARNLARQGETYTAILRHYYTGTAVVPYPTAGRTTP